VNAIPSRGWPVGLRVAVDEVKRRREKPNRPPLIIAIRPDPSIATTAANLTNDHGRPSEMPPPVVTFLGRI
jgi:hypothetical protein